MSAAIHAGHSLGDNERIVWEGRPSAFGIARHVLFAGWLTGYFAILTAVQIARVVFGQQPWTAILSAIIPAVVVGLIIAALAIAIARTTRYVATDRRLVIRYGAALPRSLSVPFSQIRDLSFAPSQAGRGDIAFATHEPLGISAVKLWPHCRIVDVAALQPRWRDVPDGAVLATRLSRILKTAEERRLSLATISAIAAE